MAQHTTTKVNSDTLTTAAIEFEEVPVCGRSMFSVLPGMPAAIALSHAACIVDSLRELAQDGVSGGGISERVAWVFESNLATAFALLNSIEIAIEIGRGQETKEAA